MLRLVQADQAIAGKKEAQVTPTNIQLYEKIICAMIAYTILYSIAITTNSLLSAAN